MQSPPHHLPTHSPHPPSPPPPPPPPSGLNARATWRSKTIKGGGKNPNWNEKRSFDVIEGDDRLQVQVYDEDTVRDDLIGSVCIGLMYLPPHPTPPLPTLTPPPPPSPFTAPPSKPAYATSGSPS